MANNPSTVHHYIPIFYLENFTNSNNQFYIYKVKEKRFKKNGQPFTPKSHFFTEKGNTFEMPGLSSDFLEAKLYSELDNDVAKVFERMKKSVGPPNYGLENMDIILLEYFFGHLYWRNPTSDVHVKYLLETRRLKELGFVIDGGSEAEERVENFFKSRPDFYKIIKCTLPMSIFGNYKHAMDLKYQILEYPKMLPGLMGDNPVILKQKGHNTYIEDALIPISKELIFSRNRNNTKYMDMNVKVLIDMMLLKQANEYVCVTDKIYIEQLESTYDSVMKGGIEDLRQLLFHGLEKDYDVI